MSWLSSWLNNEPQRDAINRSKNLAKEKGILVGISSGANFAAAQKLAKKFPNQKIATIFSDSSERYLSIELFEK